ncbi:hypothetical protein BDN72DRAFT_835609, partial [Pluteus cervinus]
MSARYTRLPDPESLQDSQRELEDAFGSDNEDDAQSVPESTPLARLSPQPPQHHLIDSVETSAIPGAYDFEREYDCPPPGSPPRPSARALPNDYGNSNGLLPVAPAGAPSSSPPQPRPSFFRRTVGALLPTHYVRVPVEAPPNGPLGGGIENDGVFANVMAKPQPAKVVRTDDGSVHVVPEDTQKESPPSYADAQADAVPPYWETTVHAPANLDPNADMIIDDLPTGSFWIFCLNFFISFFFQFVGFLLTYLLHTSHAAKFGSRAGLGFTLIQYGFYSRMVSDENDDVPPEPVPTYGSANDNSDGDVLIISPSASKDWFAFLFMTLGWFLVLSSIVGFWRVKRWESSLRIPPPPPRPISPQEVERDRAVRRNLQRVFGITFGEQEQGSTVQEHVRTDENGNVIVLPTPQALEDARLTRDLRAAGL